MNQAIGIVRTWGVLLALHAAVSWAASPEAADDGPAYGPELQGFDYPYAVARHRLHSQDQDLEMAYMDVSAARPNGRAVVLLHGKNFCAATWGQTIAVLSAAGYRVVAPDQIGFCKSSKPRRYQFSFQQLALNTHELLDALGIKGATLIGHSTGGMLAMRYALSYPDEVEQLVLVNPIGLEDWRAKGVPPVTIDQWYERELGTSAARIRAYEQSTYYAGTWRADEETWVRMLAGMYRGPGRDSVAWDSALVYDMILTQPVVYELDRLRVPTLLLIGGKDTTAIGKEFAPPAARSALGHTQELARLAAARIPRARLVEFPELGHAPQIQDPGTFHRALLDGLSAVAP